MEMATRKSSPRTTRTKTAATKTAVKKTGAAKSQAKRSAATTSVAAVDAYFAQQTPDQRALLEKLRALVVKGLPDASVSIKWGIPIYQQDGRNVCALASFKEHVAINFFAPPDALVDPGRRLEGEGKSSRLLKVRSAGDIDAAAIQRWLKATVAR
jgi:hypothetical protein